MRIFLAALLGSIAMFIWTSVAHLFLPLGEAGVRELPNEPAVLAALASGIGNQSGLYVFPGTGLSPDAPKSERDAAMRQMGEKMKTHPSGLLMFFPADARPLEMGRLMGVEFGTEFLEALLVVLLLSCTRLASFGARVGFVLVAGVLAAIATNISYWNWYGFPAVYTASYILIQVVGFLCIGLVAALVLRPRAVPAIA